jgi:hypothetical protein
MSLASYLAAPPRVILVPGVLCQPGLSLLPDGKSACKVCFVFRHCCLDADQLKYDPRIEDCLPAARYTDKVEKVSRSYRIHRLERL